MKCQNLFSKCKLSPMETTCMKCQNLFSGKKKKNIVDLLSPELAQREVKANSFSYSS